MVGFNMDGQARDRVLQLMQEKDRIENEIREQTAVLETNNNVGMHERLVDDQGYPRSDIDVYKVRHARHRIICLQNDHKALMKRIEQGLAEVHSQFLPQQSSSEGPSRANGHSIMPVNGHARAPSQRSTPSSVSNNSSARFGENDCGFATVGFVHNGSPADLAGLCEHDEILQFGSITSLNFKDISQIMDIVAHTVGQNVRVIVRRENSIINLNVSPKPWAQPGLLGCQILRRSNS